MYCSQCGRQVPDNARFCQGCGQQLTVPVAQQPLRAQPAPQSSGQPTPKKQGGKIALMIALSLVLVGGITALVVYLLGGGKPADSIEMQRPGAVRTDTETWEACFQAAQKLQDEGRYAEAVDLYSQAIAIDNARSEAYQGRARARLQLYDASPDSALLQSVREDYETCISLEPAVPDNYRDLADVCLREGDLSAAVQVLQDGYRTSEDETLLDRQAELYDSFGAVQVTMEQLDYVYTGAQTGAETMLHYMLPHVTGEGQGIDRINEALYADYLDFCSAGEAYIETIPEDAEFWDYDRPRHAWMYPYLKNDAPDANFFPGEVTAEVSYNANGVLSILFTGHYVFDYHCEYGMTFSLVTGELLSWTELFPDSCDLISDTAYNEIVYQRDNSGAMITTFLDQALEDFRPETLDYFLDRDGRLVLLTPRLAAGDGTVWNTRISCDQWVPAIVVLRPGQVPVSIQQKDHSIYADNGALYCQAVYDLPQLEGSDAQVEAINAALSARYERYVDGLMDIAPSLDTSNAPEYNYMDSCYSEVTWNTGGIVSFRYHSEWYMGGVFVGGIDGATYNVETGARANLSDLFTTPSDQVLSVIRDRIYEHVKDAAIVEDLRAAVNEYNEDNLPYYISAEGELVVCLDPYVLTYGMAGPQEIFTGLYIDR